jgi:hypothetical protein
MVAEVAETMPTAALDATVELHVVGALFCHRAPFDDCNGIIQ